MLVLYAFNFKTISYLIQSSDKSISLVQDYDFEKEDSEKSDEKSEKDEVKDFSEYLYFDNTYTPIAAYQLSVIMCRDLLYATADYSMAVYSPPEQA